MSASNHLSAYLPAILSAYGLEDASLTYLQHSDSVTYKVTDPAEKNAFLLRLHIPIAAMMGSHGANPTVLRSELVWLEALASDTDLVLQQPVRNLAGELVTSIRDEPSAKSLNATLLTWLEGEPYQREFEDESMAAQLGRILAKLHQHASAWQPPDGFTRPSRDAAYFQEMLAGLHPALEQGRIRSEDFAALEKGVGCLQALMCSLGTDRRRCGIMHADPHKGNLLFQDGQVHLIDFSFCAVGDYLFDLSIALADLQPGLHSALLQGYQSERLLPEGYQQLVQAFYIGMMVGSFNYMAARPETQPILNRKVPQVAQQAMRFLHGDWFWFTN